MVDINLFIILPMAFGILVVWVGLYVYMMLNVMRVDPHEINNREKSGLSLHLIPKAI